MYRHAKADDKESRIFEMAVVSDRKAATIACDCLRDLIGLAMVVAARRSIGCETYLRYAALLIDVILKNTRLIPSGGN